jgi:hypothetical protein
VQKIGKKYLFNRNLLLNQSLVLCNLRKTSIYACFMPQNRPKSKKHLDVYLISHGRSILAHIQVVGWVAVGGGGKAAKQGKSPFTAKKRPFIRRLPASQTSEHFLSYIKDVAF